MPRVRLARVGETRIGDGQIKVLAHFVLVDHPAHRQSDTGSAAQRFSRPLDHRLDPRQIAFCRLQQFLALVRALGDKFGVAADDQAFTRELRTGDAGDVTFIEQ